MLYTAHWIGWDNEEWIKLHNMNLFLSPYKKTHFNHPTSKWVRQTRNNYMYAVEMGLSLCKEYTNRYKKIHKTQMRLEWLRDNIPPFLDVKIDAYLATINIPRNCSPVPLAMPDEYKSQDLIQSYRLYYLGEKYNISDKLISTEYLKETWKL